MADKDTDIKEDIAEEAACEEKANEAEAKEAEESAKESAEESAEENKAEDGSADSEDKAEEKPKKKKKEKKDKKDEKIEELTDRVTRQMAEFDNFRKRTEKEKAQQFDRGAITMVEKILPVVDSFERALATVSDEQKADPFVDGMDKVFKQMMQMLEEAGVKAIEAEGTEFNPEFHNAVMHIDDDSFGENVVAEEFQKGYTYKENTVIRHSMVKVAN
ncbi:MAG: nucleotide exchange factor GrpE [Eubacterium sp.]|nr:nucleotide exchange factor GrpE [Eubacterium sp.]